MSKISVLCVLGASLFGGAAHASSQEELSQRYEARKLVVEQAVRENFFATYNDKLPAAIYNSGGRGHIVDPPDFRLSGPGISFVTLSSGQSCRIVLQMNRPNGSDSKLDIACY